MHVLQVSSQISAYITIEVAKNSWGMQYVSGFGDNACTTLAYALEISSQFCAYIATLVAKNSWSGQTFKSTDPPSDSLLLSLTELSSCWLSRSCGSYRSHGLYFVHTEYTAIRYSANSPKLCLASISAGFWFLGMKWYVSIPAAIAYRTRWNDNIVCRLCSFALTAALLFTTDSLPPKIRVGPTISTPR
jgi:hypothetical protein